MFGATDHQPGVRDAVNRLFTPDGLLARQCAKVGPFPGSRPEQRYLQRVGVTRTIVNSGYIAKAGDHAEVIDLPCGNPGAAVVGTQFPNFRCVIRIGLSMKAPAYR